ncbi:MAG: YccF domain-containing protein [Chitinophagales bacterium]|nr:YccF domain-containing protein [Chitinophagales bacterium]
MAPFHLLGNIIWLVFGGLISALIYFVCGVLFTLTIIGIPFGIQCFKIAGLVLAPFGREVVSSSSNSGCLATLFNIIWILCGGLWTAITHIVFGILLYITIIGIPFGRQHFKLVEISLMPFGKRVL